MHGMPKGIVPSKSIGEYLASYNSRGDPTSQPKVSMDVFVLAYLVDCAQVQTKLRSLLLQTARKIRPPALFITEASALRFAREYGIMPQLLGRREIKVSP